MRHHLYDAWKLVVEARFAWAKEKLKVAKTLGTFHKMEKEKEAALPSFKIILKKKPSNLQSLKVNTRRSLTRIYVLLNRGLRPLSSILTGPFPFVETMNSVGSMFYALFGT
ncbi:hypothetical protein ACH5RR_008364 [Cinchona calisaya]|uniref:Uncharacterized protein n=1 Tax=Cinchona calisaya TaxID=153742 RepID=A0ABD3AE37_9GENT